MKRITWIIEEYLFDEYQKRLTDSIKKSGMTYLLYSDLNHEKKIEDFLTKKFGDDDIVIFHGSLQYGRRISRLPLYPGVFLTLENYECFNYYGYFGDHLLNSQYMMMGLNDVLRNKNRIFDYLKTNRVFIRPSNGYKSFTGQLLPKETFDLDFKVLTSSYGGLDMNTLVVLSPEQQIEEEYRFIVVDGQVISGAMYMDKFSRDSWTPYYDVVCKDNEAFDFAEKMSLIYHPDLAYNIDVCKLTNGEYKLIELNSFCCGSMYGNDCDKVVDAINELCIKEYNELFEI